jgi:hypothetical protein
MWRAMGKYYPGIATFATPFLHSSLKKKDYDYRWMA